MNRTVAYKAIALALFMFVVLALMACGSGGGASPECLDKLYSGTLSEETRSQLSQPVSKMDTEVRLDTIGALTNGLYGDSAGCDDFVQELDDWQDTPEGKDWHEANQEAIASQVISVSGHPQCKDSISYDYFYDAIKDQGAKSMNYKVRQGDESFSKSGEYTYEVTRVLRVLESFEDNNRFLQYDWELECTLTMDVDTKRRSVTNIEVVDANLAQDGFTIATYTK